MNRNVSKISSNFLKHSAVLRRILKMVRYLRVSSCALPISLAFPILHEICSDHSIGFGGNFRLGISSIFRNSGFSHFLTSIHVAITERTWFSINDWCCSDPLTHFSQYTPIPAQTFKCFHLLSVEFWPPNFYCTLFCGNLFNILLICETKARRMWNVLLISKYQKNFKANEIFSKTFEGYHNSWVPVPNSILCGFFAILKYPNEWK